MVNFTANDETFSYNENPGYYDLTVGVYRSTKWLFGQDQMKNYTFPNDFVSQINDNFDFPFDDLYPIFYFTVLFTAARYLFEFCICKVCLKLDDAIYSYLIL